MHPDFPGQMSNHLVTALYFNLELRIGQGLFDDAFHFNQVFFGHISLIVDYCVKISGPASVTTTQCSK